MGQTTNKAPTSMQNSRRARKLKLKTTQTILVQHGMSNAHLARETLAFFY